MKSCDIETPGQTQTVRTGMAHLAYQPLLPTGNKYLQQKWDKASYELHREKVKSAKATINTAPPKTYAHLTLKLKTQKLEEEWAMKIQRENNMLMEKISHIMRTTGGVDNKNFYDRKSLGKEKRQLELLRITKENQMILLRLSQCRSHYDVRRWHEDWVRTLKVMDSIARYPRGTANLQKGQEKPTKKCSDCNKEQKIGPASNKASGKAESEEDEKRKENSKKESTGTKIQQDTATYSEPTTSDTTQMTADKPPHTAETSSSPEGSELSNPTHTP
ncbi:hypothetical protein ABVT39_017349 [Epinephelus coioides]